MKTLLAAATAVSLLAIAAPASAGVYGSLGYSQSQYEAPDVDFDEVTGRLGWGSDTTWWGFEAEASFGVGEETVAGVDTKLTSDLAAFAVAHFDVSEQFTLFARAGYGVTRFEFKPGVDVSVDGPAYGVGAQFNFGERDGVRFDYTYHDLTTDTDEASDKFTVSWVRKFR